MLRIGLSGGIGAGKSTVSTAFAECGGIVVDGDVISREVVQPGTEGLAALVEAFGPEILQPDGALNRPALAAVAFSDDEKRATLNGIVHPLVGTRRAELIEAAPADAVIIEDIPLLVESQMASMFPLVVIVNAAEDVRIARLIEYRGFTEADARARIAAQAKEIDRRLVADVWLENSGSPDELKERALALWRDRILPFAHNLDAGTPAATKPVVVAADPSWPAQASRIVNRLKTACGHRAVRVDHIGSTAVPGLDAKDVIDVQVTVSSLDVADELRDALLTAGYPEVPDVTTDVAHTEDQAMWRKRFHASADPGRPTNVHLRVDGWPGQQFALLFRDWLVAEPAVREEYLEVKREAAASHPTTADYADGKEPWVDGAYRRAWQWAENTGWRA
ncbi:dephospho-CoA kinase [Mycobacterium antarcticum]|uniref:dephospho-CoA kinase n=1 Tax=unclassified Mycolicibacterium TaxID=2636767 RepID=UPI0023A43BE8|nr:MULTISPECIES: dephospho-CoA kinase [unclassified Mycolicibacterium]BDX32460.1 dephospho-CoA kinase [Mycolicibacterium sp. TUM20985]GLP75649.1 dephospho-CoA kinase [Mycolicibacterium sp. TUM20983]GLP84000.1 dephospho-CoA kinase [Mycolicibacterium sp. TUM20984]